MMNWANALLLLIICSCLQLTVWSNHEGTGNKIGSSAQPAAGLSHGLRASLPVIRISKSGSMRATHILKQQLASDLRLPLRDLRVVDPSYPSQIQAAFIARPDAVLLSLEGIKVIAQRDAVLVFNPNAEEAQAFVHALHQELLTAADQPFEHLVIETALSIVCGRLSHRTQLLEPAAASALRALQAESRGLDGLLETQIDALLPLKNQLDELLKRAKEVQRATSEVLHSDEAMAALHLTAPRTDTMGLQILFENYLHEMEWVVSEAEDALAAVSNTEHTVELQLDLIRNRILRFELALSIASFIAACGAFVTGLFGMNLANHLELHPQAFLGISLAMGLAMVIGHRAIVGFARQGKLM